MDALLITGSRREEEILKRSFFTDRVERSEFSIEVQEIEIPIVP